MCHATRTVYELSRNCDVGCHCLLSSWAQLSVILTVLVAWRSSSTAGAPSDNLLIRCRQLLSVAVHDTVSIYSIWSSTNGSACSKTAQQCYMPCCKASVSCRRYEDAFHKVLTMEDVSRVAWLCSQVDPGSLLSQSPPVLSQQILLPLLQQLGCDLIKVNTSTKFRNTLSTPSAVACLFTEIRPDSSLKSAFI